MEKEFCLEEVVFEAHQIDVFYKTWPELDVDITFDRW